MFGETPYCVYSMVCVQKVCRIHQGRMLLTSLKKSPQRELQHQEFPMGSASQEHTHVLPVLHLQPRAALCSGELLLIYKMGDQLQKNQEKTEI